jgi:hypothetical protein
VFISKVVANQIIRKKIFWKIILLAERKMAPIFDKYKFELCYRLFVERSKQQGLPYGSLDGIHKSWAGIEDDFIATETYHQRKRQFPFKLTSEVKPL